MVEVYDADFPDEIGGGLEPYLVFWDCVVVYDVADDGYHCCSVFISLVNIVCKSLRVYIECTPLYILCQFFV